VQRPRFMPFHLFFDLTRSSSLGNAGRNLQPSDVLLTCLPAAAVPNDSFLSSTCTHPSPLYFPPNSSAIGCVCLAPSSAPCARPSPLDRIASLFLLSMLKTNTFLPAIRPWLSEVQSVRRLHRQRAGHLPPHLISRPVTRPTHPALQRLQVHADECGAMQVGNCTQLLLALRSSLCP
jgi:hypothetical protein